MGGHDIGKTAATIPAAKRLVRAWVKKWLGDAPTEVVWKTEDTGVHFTGFIERIQVADYYFCPEPKGNWHKGFRVWFGGTYYVTDFESPEQAREAVQATYTRWLIHARTCLLK